MALNGDCIHQEWCGIRSQQRWLIETCATFIPRSNFLLLRDVRLRVRARVCKTACVVTLESVRCRTLRGHNYRLWREYRRWAARVEWCWMCSNKATFDRSNMCLCSVFALLRWVINVNIPVWQIMSNNPPFNPCKDLCFMMSFVCTVSLFRERLVGQNAVQC